MLLTLNLNETTNNYKIQYYFIRKLFLWDIHCFLKMEKVFKILRKIKSFRRGL